MQTELDSDFLLVEHGASLPRITITAFLSFEFVAYATYANDNGTYSELPTLTRGARDAHV